MIFEWQFKSRRTKTHVFIQWTIQFMPTVYYLRIELKYCSLFIENPKLANIIYLSFMFEFCKIHVSMSILGFLVHTY